MSPSDDDRRREPRVPTRIEVDYASQNTFLFAYITDISSLGIFVNTDDPMSVGTELRLRFSPPAEVRSAMENPPEGPIEVAGEVVWNTVDENQKGNPGMGVRFSDLPDIHRAQLLELVRAIAYLDDRSA